MKKPENSDLFSLINLFTVLSMILFVSIAIGYAKEPDLAEKIVRVDDLAKLRYPTPDKQPIKLYFKSTLIESQEQPEVCPPSQQEYVCPMGDDGETDMITIFNQMVDEHREKINN